MLTTPLMLTMAQAFQASGRDPELLLRSEKFGSRDALEKGLLDAFVPTAYDPLVNTAIPERRRWSAERAGHWLGYLATHLKKQKPDAHDTGAQDIEWWQLGTTMSLPARMLVSGALCGLVSGTAAALVHALTAAPSTVLLTMFLNVLGVGLSFGLMHGFASKIEASGAFRPSRMQIRVRGESRRLRSRRVRERLLPRAGGGLAGGLVFGVVFGSGAAVYAVLLSYPWSLALLIYGDWLVAGALLGLRLWLPLSGRLPWRVNAFLEDARDRGVLRQAGVVYQFRHARLRDRLAEAHRRHEQPTERGSR